jgi:hypothetical protein
MLLESGQSDRGQSRSVRPSSLFGVGGTQLLQRVVIRERRGLPRMGPLIVRRRRFLLSLASAAICGPSVVRASSLMRVSARYCISPETVPSWATTQDALALLQYEMERRFDETLFGAASLPAEDEYIAPIPSPVIAEAKITALWELRTLFGPRGSPPKPLEDLPVEVRSGLSSMLGACPDASCEALAPRFSRSPARSGVHRSI